MIALWLLACAAPPAFPDPAAALLAELDTDGSGALSETELRAPHPAELLRLLDTDGDGEVSVEELRADLDRVPRRRASDQPQPPGAGRERARIEEKPPQPRLPAPPDGR